MKEERERVTSPLLPRINFRPLLVAAFGISFAVFLYTRIRFGGLSPTDFLLLACFFPLCFTPLSKRRFLALTCCFTLFAGAGTLGIHLYTEAYLSGKEEGEYFVEGTVTRIVAQNGYCFAELGNLVFDGEEVGGNFSLTVADETVRPGDRLAFSATVSRFALPTGTGDAYAFVNDVRYHAETGPTLQEERDFHPMLFLNAHVFDLLQEKMGGEEADVSYALLTGNSGMVDGGFMTAVRRGGIAHIFAVSGLHIGILYGAVLLLCRPLKKYAALPAIAVSVVYCALCGFTVSALRALIMCIALSVNTFLGRKPDMLNSLSLAAVAVLLFLPAQWLSAGFRLSFGACIGLALFSGMLSRGMKRARIPRFLREYLSASLAVQLFTFPIVMESFGYFAVWGLALNLVVVPLLPFAFLTLLLCTLLSLVIPPAAGFFLIFPKGLFAVLLYLFAAVDFGWTLTGFAFGAAGVVWLTACLYATERVRLRPAVRGGVAALAAVLFTLVLIAENCLFGGVVIDVNADDEGMLVLVRVEDESVLILGGEVTLDGCEDFLARHTQRIDCVVVLTEDRANGLNAAAFLGADTIYCLRQGEHGLHEVDVVCGQSFQAGEFYFFFASDELLFLNVRGAAVAFGTGDARADADLFVEMGGGTLKYFLDYDIILSL